jgi:hypothetical protein
MDQGIVLQPTVAGLALAAIAVIAGAPLFSDGIRSLRLARAFRSLRPTRVADAPGGLAHVRGRVILESPLFSPLSGTACAGFRLEVRGPRGRVARPIEQFRPFRILDTGVLAHVEPAGSRCRLSEGARRELKPGDSPSRNLAGLLEQVPEVSWLLRSGASLVLVERVLAAGAEAHVVGTLRRSRITELHPEASLARTGTDDAATFAAQDAEPECWIDSGDHLNYLLVSDREPEPREFRISPLRIAGCFVGPALSLAGLLVLADAADRLRVAGG